MTDKPSIQNLDNIQKEALLEIEKASNNEEASELKNKYLGRKGVFSLLLKGLADVPKDKKKEVGASINSAKNIVDSKLNNLLVSLDKEQKEKDLKNDRTDITLPGRNIQLGRAHPITQITDEIESIFISLGFDVAEGPEVESDYYNFEALNIPKDHPAREMQDTFYIATEVDDNNEKCLRTHTSPVQIRVMENKKPPLRIIAPGTVYRRDSDVTHTPMFHQIEGFMVDEGITFGDLKGVLTYFLQTMFGTKTKLRFRPSFFPFTEPSAEVDISCVICKGKGCRVCSGTGWIEILGSGMIHPEVFRSVNYDTEKFTGFAFGLGIERIAMLKFGIDDLRMFFENDKRFLSQF